MANDDHSQKSQRRRRRHDSHGTHGGGSRGGSYSDTTTATLKAAMATPHGPSTSTLGSALFRCGLVPGGRCPAASPVGHVGRCSPLWSFSVAGWPDLCATPGTSTSGGMDIVDDPRHSHPWSPSAVGRPLSTHLRRCGHRGWPPVLSPRVFLHSRLTRPSRHPWCLHHRHRGHCG
jgi:hypothetical protein